MEGVHWVEDIHHTIHEIASKPFSSVLWMNEKLKTSCESRSTIDLAGETIVDTLSKRETNDLLCLWKCNV